MNYIENYKPFSFQEKAIVKGLNILNQYNGLFVMDETGLGKTITVATILKNIDLKNKSVLIISPNIHKPSWVDIMKKANINATVSGNRKLPNENFDYIIVDEAHNIGTKKGKTYKELFKKIHLYPTKVILISATPYNNNISAFIDLCALIPFPFNTAPYLMLHHFGMSAMYWEKEYEKALRFDKGSFQDINKKVETKNAYKADIKNLSKIVFLFSIRNTRKDIVENYKEDINLMGSFPIVTNEKIEYESSKALAKKINETVNIINTSPFAWQNKKAYFINSDTQESLNGIYRTFLCKRLESSVQAFYISLQNGYNKIRDLNINDEITIGDISYNATEGFINDIEKDKKTYETLISIWKDENDDNKLNAIFDNITEKTIIFTEYVDTLKLLIEKAQELKIPFLAFHGQTNEKEFEKIEIEFNANLPQKQQKNNVKLLLCTDVLSEGINLHRATKMIHFDSKWNPSKIIQREGRINRILNDNKKGQEITTASIAIPYQIESILSLEEKTYKKTQDAGLLLNPDSNCKIKTFNFPLKPDVQYNDPNENKFYYIFFSSDLGQIIFDFKYTNYRLASSSNPIIRNIDAYQIRNSNLWPKNLFLSEGYKDNFMSINHVKAYKRYVNKDLLKIYETLFYNVMYNKTLLNIIQDLYDNKQEINPAFAFINDMLKNKQDNNGRIEFSEITAYE